MTLLRGDFFTCWKEANNIRKDELLKNFFYFNSKEDRNIFFGEWDYNEADVFDLQKKQNINIHIDSGSKDVLTILKTGKTEDFDYREQRINTIPLTISLFTYYPTDELNNEAYKANTSEDILTKLDYFEYAVFCLEKSYKVMGGNRENGRTNGIPFIQHQFILNSLSVDTIEQGDLDEANLFLENIKSTTNI